MIRVSFAHALELSLRAHPCIVVSRNHPQLTRLRKGMAPPWSRSSCDETCRLAAETAASKLCSCDT